MKPVFERINKAETGSFLVRRFEEKQFSAPYHFHPEYELTLIVQGSGKRYVGSSMADFYPGDLVLLGENLPHCWKTEACENDVDSVSVVVHFNAAFIQKDLASFPEFNSIIRMMQASVHGLQFMNGNKVVAEKMMQMQQASDPFERLMSLLFVLQHLAVSNEYKILDQQSLFPQLSEGNKERMHAVMAYIVEHFQEQPTLTKAAAIAAMTPHAFCKYFKKLTRKTFLQVVTDYRVDFACRQLINTQKAVSEIGYESGFNDGAHFHRTFKSATKHSPLQYRNAFMKKLV